MDRELLCSIEIPDMSDLAVVSQDMSPRLSWIDVAISVAGDVEPGEYRARLTTSEARALHAALGAALEAVEP